MARETLARDREILTVEQAADFLQVHKITVYRYIREGRLPAVKLGKLYRLFSRDVEAFLEAMRHQPDRAAPDGK
jgi:excisionase family DNA binding protein